MSGEGPDLTAIRRRFVRGLPDQHEHLESLLDQITEDEPAEPIAEARSILHRISGMAGTVGLPDLGAAAHDCDALMTEWLEGETRPALRSVCDALEGYLEISVRVCIRHLHPGVAA